MQPDVLQRPLCYSSTTPVDHIEARVTLQLPYDYPYSSTSPATVKPGLLILSLPGDVCLEQTANVSTSIMLLAAFSILLARYTREEVIHLDLPTTQMHSTHSLTTSVAISIDLTDSPSFTSLIQQIEASLHTRPEQHIAAAPGLAQNSQTITFSYQHLLQHHSHPFSDRWPHLDGDLRLDLIDSSEGIEARWIYHTGRFEAATIQRMHTHFQTLLASIVAHPDWPVGQLPLMTEAERQQILVEWNATATPYPDNHCIHQIFEEQVLRWPDTPALTFEGTTLSYAELNTRANQLAHYLRRIGVGRETLVGIYVHRSFEMVIGILGVLKAGGAYVPLDPTYPAERLTFMVTDAKMPVILSQYMIDQNSWLLKLTSDNTVRDYQPSVVYLDNHWGDIAQEPDTNPHSDATVDDLAYVIYTSGSTGRPKGTLLTHRGICSLVIAQQQAFGVGPGKRVLQFASCSFDASVWEWVMALGTGATLCLATQETMASGSDLLRLLHDETINIATLPPSLLNVLPVEKLPALMTLITAGEACTTDLIARWAPGRSLFNAYGPTETTICASWYQCSEEDLYAPSIGHPLPNVQIYILDALGKLVPVGVPGELHIGGLSLARGYLNRPDLTAERFIDWTVDTGTATAHRFNDLPTTIRLYKTGDLARYRADGNIDFLGRIDHQVKLRGFRIEPGEIEVTLRQHPAVQDAVVLVREDITDLQRLVAYIVIDNRTPDPDGFAIDPASTDHFYTELRTFLHTKLPDYMIPSAFVTLKSLPLTPNGKVDRQALPLPETDNTGLDRDTAPRTLEEVLLADIWANVLGLKHIGIHDDFFALGGHSLLAARAITRINAVFHRDIPLRILFESPTVATFAHAISHDTMQELVTPANLSADVVLDPAIVPPVTDQPLCTTPEAIFLTGATGFLGAFLLQELLMQTRATIYCLVRATHDREAEQRIEQTLTRYQIWQDDWRSRIVAVAGDLRKPRLGLSIQTFQNLSSTIDVIYHAGAYVKYLYPYSALKAANVQGSIEILRMACQDHLKPVHYVSTLAVAAESKDVCVYEQDDLATCMGTMGYHQSKWVAEGIMHLARARGLPVSIYRPGRIGSHSQNGILNPDDFFVRLLAGCFELGLAPDVPMVENLIPVDFTAQAIVHLSQQQESQSKTFHLLNPQPTDWLWVTSVAQELGYPLQMIPYAEWYEALLQAIQSNPDHALHALLTFIPPEHKAAPWIDNLAQQAAQGKWSLCLSLEAASQIDGLTNQDFDTQNTDAGLAGSTVRCPTIDTILLERMLTTGTRQGLFPVPGYVESSLYTFVLP